MGIYVWGTGCGASELLEQGLALDRICAFVDSFPCGDTFLGRPVILPSQLHLEETDLLIITTRHADAVARTCNELGIPGENCLYLKITASFGIATETAGQGRSWEKTC